MLHNVAVSSKLCIQNGRVFFSCDSKLHEKRNKLVKDRIFKVKVKVKVKVNQLLKDARTPEVQTHAHT